MIWWLLGLKASQGTLLCMQQPFHWTGLAFQPAGYLFGACPIIIVLDALVTLFSASKGGGQTGEVRPDVYSLQPPS